MLEQVREPPAGPGVPIMFSLEMRVLRCSTWGSVGGTTLDSRRQLQQSKWVAVERCDSEAVTCGSDVRQLQREIVQIVPEKMGEWVNGKVRLGETFRKRSVSCVASFLGGRHRAFEMPSSKAEDADGLLYCLRPTFYPSLFSGM